MINSLSAAEGSGLDPTIDPIRVLKDSNFITICINEAEEINPSAYNALINLVNKAKAQQSLGTE